ncbi:hypothetical protein [Anaerotignum sp. MB30-C6]|uniref:hypothetical protein n=1 Tax=Anaerotignum sp. MB30-C6 TaxID=3070814 RepID=UPI0027DBAB5B|nr:hypothetical protein [Anaerotignum sp. MB30-C6]WMI79916.1 hypothetical protein RBQ60_08655 [Anaerotignum sp. MB30-C6]
MKKWKKSTAIGLMVMAISATGVTAFGATQYGTPAEVVAAITGRTVESVVTERNETGKTYGTIASDEGKLEEFKTEILEVKKENLAAQVAEGRITQEKADAILASLEENQADCDGTGSARIGRTNEAKFGSNGGGMGNGGGKGQGGFGRGNSCGLRDGSCNR